MSFQRMLNGAIRLRAGLSNIREFTPVLQRSWLATASSLPESAQPTRAKEVVRDPGEGVLSITWRDGSASRYPFVYLRDICRCPQCFHKSSLQRLLDPVRELDPNMVASKVEVSVDGRQITLTWPNDHVSSFDSDWLHERRLPEHEVLRIEEERGIIPKDVVLWGWGTSDNIPTLSFDDVISDESAQMTWLQLIGSHGLVLITGASTDEGKVNKLGDMLGYLRTMWFGESSVVENSITDDPDGASVASIPQATCAYNEYRGGLHLIHCRQELAGTGGEHTFVDGFSIAQHLKDNDPESFKRLCTARISYQRDVANRDAEFKMSFSHPVIKLDQTGRLSRMIYNEVNRTSFVNVPPEEIPHLYRAYYEVSRMIRDPGYIIEHKLREGDIISMDCDRVLCGRNPFGPEVSGNEMFECGFSDKDMTSSRRRILKTKQAQHYSGFESDEPVI